MNNFQDKFSGKRIGLLHVLRVLDKGGNGRHATYECACDCGNVIKIRSSLLTTATEDRSCGRCLVFVAGGSANAKALNAVWFAIRHRCYEVTEEENPYLFNRYRKRGIRAYKLWMEDKKEFIRWARANGWERGLQIDRIDNDRHYTPSNCRFVSAEANCNNRENTPFVQYRDNKPESFARLVRKYGVVSHSTAFQRYFSMGWDIHSALTTPARQGCYR